MLNTTTDVTVSMKKDITGTKDITLYKRTLTPITIMVGAVPVVILPEFEVKVGVDGQLVAGVTAGMTLTTETWATISLGRRLEPRVWLELRRDAEAAAGLRPAHGHGLRQRRPRLRGLRGRRPDGGAQALRGAGGGHRSSTPGGR